MKHYFQTIILAAGAVFAATGMAQAADLTVEVTGLKSARGKIMVAVYDKSENFLKQPFRAAAVDAQTDKVKLLITDLPPGDYALSVFQDENNNGKLDTNPIGMPVEPYGFSNDAAGNYGPPSFAQSLVQLPDAGKLISIKLR
ncbi:DUF2141 domain-containing protein [Undibacterium sp. TJN19]|uniref:DUF2141 domain-containing protein n=1 Tax=Undibacterium sp. TJN19 TaxID=3413055 RepID=UPI003BF389D1